MNLSDIFLSKIDNFADQVYNETKEKCDSKEIKYIANQILTDETLSDKNKEADFMRFCHGKYRDLLKYRQIAFSLNEMIQQFSKEVTGD
jgi:hypothetical protein